SNYRYAPEARTLVLESRGSARSACPKCIARPDDASHRKSAIGSRAKTLPATTQHNRKASARRSRLAAKRVVLKHKNKTATISANARSDSGLRQPIADDREWNHAFRYRSTDRQARPDRFASAQACAR